ncbi:unnamed protein product [Rotaria sordida]|uniref:Uncharacterized protein n=2 Tax=Rotaria sordida TaxID=392033 RepID=A0A814A5X4_9BILA|nr:unnamed protein product [Rotaria sordida]CAF1115333.1 unnamed protein product [Rotaria sordida]
MKISVIEPARLSLESEINDENLKMDEIIPRPTPDQILSKSTIPFTLDTQNSEHHENHSSPRISNKRNYKLISCSSRQVYRTISESNQYPNTNQTNEQFTQLTLSQLELLENNDPMISNKIGVPFILRQMLTRSRDAQQSTKRLLQQIQRDYPKIRIERQTIFEKAENESSIEQKMQIKSLENPNRLTIPLYLPLEQHSLVKHTNSTRTLSKKHPSQLDDIYILEHSTEQQRNLFHHIPNVQSINEDDLPRVASLKIFDLHILTQCDIHSLGLILHCMPNLREFSFTFIVEHLHTLFIDVLLNGNNWQQILTSHLSHLTKFDIHMSFLTHDGLVNSKLILDSFRCFCTQYDGWHMAISRWKTFQDFTLFFTRSHTDQSDQYVESLSSLIDLSTIITLKFKENNDLRRSHVAPHIIRPKLIQLELKYIELLLRFALNESE